MSKFGDFWELRKTFTDDKEFLSWLHRTFHFYSKVYVMYEGEDHYCVYRFFLADLDSSFDFFHANEEREERLGNDFCKTRPEADIVWKHEEYLRLSLEQTMKRSDCCENVLGTMIITTECGHHVFKRKSDPKPASRN